jgi:hypothetical protein
MYLQVDTVVSIDDVPTGTIRPWVTILHTQLSNDHFLPQIIQLP